jgi:hypothetical protein
MRAFQGEVDESYLSLPPRALEQPDIAPNL